MNASGLTGPVADRGDVPPRGDLREASQRVELRVEPEAAGQRLDAFLAQMLPQYSRVQLRKVIGSGGVKVNGAGTKVAHRLAAGDRVCVQLPPMNTAGPRPEPIPLDVLYEDEHLIAVNKPPGMVVHPARGHWSGTLASALAYHFRQLSGVGGPTRPGIVHRLDRDTSGVMVVAKTDPMHYALAAQFEARTTKKEYLAITAGLPDRDRDLIQQPIGVHPHQREKMAIREGHPTSRPAVTFYEVEQRLGAYALVRVWPRTGRTHQIRVHLAHIGCPVLCDKLYGGRAQVTRRELSQAGGQAVGRLRPEGAIEAAGSPDDVVLARQALHAWRIELVHPATGRPIQFVAPLPEDFRRVLTLLGGREPL
jgi:23S rRNA pseudouridine1911/1915/1917 synthase